ncbi:MAG TPA: hypothetical protein VN667_06555 [Burkholderiales bacterium]|nr:hypothetical protein [Burkholderiales bacterium]
MTRAARLLVGVLMLLCADASRPDQTGPTVLFVATERMTSLALDYRFFPHFARMGFGTPAKPWHTWFATPAMTPLVYLPSYLPGKKAQIEAKELLGNGFQGRQWRNAFEALASLDADGNGVIEGDEMRDLYVWTDFQRNGTLAARNDALLPARKIYDGFDLRIPAQSVNGYARLASRLAFAAMVRTGQRSHLLELAVGEFFPSRSRAYLSYAALPANAALDSGSAFNGWWLWTATNADQWKDATRPWGKEAGGRLLLAVAKGRISGLVQYTGPVGDRINLPLSGEVRGTQGSLAQWTSVSPLGLTRSELRLEQVFGHPVLRGRSWSNRNGKVSEWTWEATYEKPLD